MRRNLSLTRGTSLSLAAVARDDDGPIDLTDASIVWRIGTQDRKATRVSKTGTVVDAAQGEYAVALDPADTADLPPGFYAHEAELTEADGTVRVILSGVLELRRDLQ